MATEIDKFVFSLYLDTKGFKNGEKQAVASIKNISRAFKASVAVAVVAKAGQMVWNLVTGFKDLNIQIGQFGRRTGEEIGTLGRWIKLIEKLNVSKEKVMADINNVSKQMNSPWTRPDLIQKAMLVGVPYDRAQAAKTATDLLEDVNKYAWKKYNRNPERFSAALQNIFGLSEGTVDYFLQVPGDKMKSELAKTIPNVTKERVNQAENLQKAIHDLKTPIDNIKLTVSDKVVPKITDTLTSINKIVGFLTKDVEKPVSDKTREWIDALEKEKEFLMADTLLYYPHTILKRAAGSDRYTKDEETLYMTFGLNASTGFRSAKNIANSVAGTRGRSLLRGQAGKIHGKNSAFERMDYWLDTIENRGYKASDWTFSQAEKESLEMFTIRDALKSGKSIKEAQSIANQAVEHIINREAKFAEAAVEKQRGILGVLLNPVDLAASYGKMSWSAIKSTLGQTFKGLFHREIDRPFVKPDNIFKMSGRAMNDGLAAKEVDFMQELIKSGITGPVASPVWHTMPAIVAAKELNESNKHDFNNSNLGRELWREFLGQGAVNITINTNSSDPNAVAAAAKKGVLDAQSTLSGKMSRSMRDMSYTGSGFTPRLGPAPAR